MIGAFQVTLTPDPLTLVIARADGTTLWDGLPPADTGLPNDGTDPPSQAGFAVREITTDVQYQYGSFQLTDHPVVWRAAHRATSISTAGGVLSFDAVDDAGVVATVTVRSDASGEADLVMTPATPTSRKMSADGHRTWAQIGAKCIPDDRFLGFGRQARDVEHHGSVVPIFVSEDGIGKEDTDDPLVVYYIAGTRHASNFPAPIYLARRGYVGALDGAGRASFGMCADPRDMLDALRISEDTTASTDGSLTFRIFDGPTPAQAIGRSTAHYGRPRVPPRLAFAPWIDAIFGQSNVIAASQWLRTNDFPASVIWTEDWRGGAYQGDNYRLTEEWDADTKLYPDLKGLATTLHQTGFAFFVYFNTFVQTGTNIFAEADPKNVLIKKSDGTDLTFILPSGVPAGMIDLTNPDGMSFTAQKLKNALAQGVDGWMGDYAEWMPLESALHDGSDPWATHDLYPRLWQKTQRAALDDTTLGADASPVDRRIAFVRSCWLGCAPDVDVFWAGDQRTDMEDDDGLPTVVRIGLGLGVTGISTFGHDIGGYQSATNPPSTKETYFRWTTLGALSPVMRTHHGTEPKLEWRFDKDADTIAHFQRWSVFHMQLLPLWEKLAQDAHDTGLTIWRHMAIAYPGDSHVWDQGDQEFMIGDSILVAPVTTAGSTGRSAYLPYGSRWWPWTPGGVVDPAPALAGDTNVTVDAPLTEIPIFVREGSIIPMLPSKVRTVLEGIAGVPSPADVGDDRVLEVFAGPDTTFAEKSGALTYSLSGAASLTLPAAKAAWNGSTLTTCDPAKPVAPCIVQQAGRAHALLVGPGSLTLDGATLTVTGGSATRSLDVEVRGDR
jgi:alpha-glucosidase